MISLSIFYPFRFHQCFSSFIFIILVLLLFPFFSSGFDTFLSLPWLPFLLSWRVFFFLPRLSPFESKAFSNAFSSLSLSFFSASLFPCLNFSFEIDFQLRFSTYALHFNLLLDLSACLHARENLSLPSPSPHPTSPHLAYFTIAVILGL